MVAKLTTILSGSAEFRALIRTCWLDPFAGNLADPISIDLTFAEHAPGRNSDIVGSGVPNQLMEIVMTEEKFPEPGAYDPSGEPEWDVASLRDALKALSPDCPEPIWVGYRIAPLANAARDFPERAESLRRIAIDWSSGKLQGRPAVMWTQAVGDARPRKDSFQRLWARYLNSNYQGRRVTVLSIFFEARKAGWTQEPAEWPSEDETEVKQQ